MQKAGLKNGAQVKNDEFVLLLHNLSGEMPDLCSILVNSSLPFGAIRTHFYSLNNPVVSSLYNSPGLGLPNLKSEIS